MKLVNAYEADDGTLHSCEQDVVHHEVRRNLKNLFEGAGYDEQMSHDLMMLLIVKTGKFLEELNRYHRMYNGGINPDDRDTLELKLKEKQ